MEPIILAAAIKKGLSFAQRILNPIISQVESELSGKAQLAAHNFLRGYSKYLENAFERHSFFNSVVFKNQQKKLLDYYIPLTIQNDQNQIPLKIDEYPKEAIEKIKHILIQDTAGMGKSTLLKFLFIECISNEAGIPIFIELRKLNKKTTLKQFISSLLSDAKGRWNEEVFFRILESGKFVFFFDGYDEISEEDRGKVTSDIKLFIEKSPRNTFFITSRAEEGLGAFPSFLKHNILPLTENESFTLIRKYARSELAESLIERLKLPENRSIHEFLANPLLTSLLFKSFEFKQKIPLKRHIFYRQVYESLFETHDLAKEGGEFDRQKRSGIDVDRFDKILSAFGAITYKNKSLEMDKFSALQYLEQAKQLATEKKIIASDFLHDLTHAVPLLVEEGTQLRWSHKSIQEYFAAQYICRNTPEKKIEALRKLFEPNDRISHINILTLCGDIDKNAFDHVISKTLCDELIREYESFYPVPPTGVPKSLIEDRKTILTGKGDFFVFTKFPEHHGTEDFKEEASRCFDYIKDFRGGPSLDIARIYNAKPAIGRLPHPKETFIDLTYNSVQYSFIETITSLPPSPDYQSWPNRFTIDNRVDSAANNFEIYEQVTHAIYRCCDWKFSYSKALSFISEIESDSQDKSDLEPW
ncbi:MAG TPA: NACHT domain-containing protein [Cellvibrionaceae bacterium]